MSSKLQVLDWKKVLHYFQQRLIRDFLGSRITVDAFENFYYAEFFRNEILPFERNKSSLYFLTSFAKKKRKQKKFFFLSVLTFCFIFFPRPFPIQLPSRSKVPDPLVNPDPRSTIQKKNNTIPIHDPQSKTRSRSTIQHVSG